MASTTSTSDQPGMITPAQAAQLLMMTTERLRQLAREGFIPKASGGFYQLVPTVQGYLKFLRDEERRSIKSAAGASLQAARRSEIELRIATKQRDLVARPGAAAAMDAVVGMVRKEFVSFGARATRDAKMCVHIETMLNGALARISVKLAEQKVALATGGDQHFVLEDEEA